MNSPESHDAPSAGSAAKLPAAPAKPGTALAPHGFSVVALFFLSALVALVATCLLYKQAWQIPGLRELRDNRLVFALWLLASPVVGTGLVLARRTTRRSATLAGVWCLVAGVPVSLLGGGLNNISVSSRDKAVLCNLRQLAAAADQYFLENRTTTVLRYEDLVGPDKYVKAMNAVRGESYRHNFPLRAGDTLTVEVGHGRTISYELDAPASVKPATGKSAAPLTATSDALAAKNPVRRGTMCASCHARK